MAGTQCAGHGIPASQRVARVMANRPVVRWTIVVFIVFLIVAMLGMLALGIALYRS